MRFVTHSADETEALGERLAKTLHGGEIIAFTGDLGAGKTAFTRGLARGLGIPMRVTSPTYTIVNEYTGGRLPLFHFDMYRLGSSDELFDIGWEDYLQRGGVCAVEWSENVADAMQGAISVRIGRDSDEQRTITIEGGGLTGQGLFHGDLTSIGYLPAQHTDSIFSSIGEQLGMLGCLAALFLLLAIVLRCIQVGMKSPDYMNRLICIGIASMLLFQILINVGVCLGLFPVVGLALPFLSYGGSSILTSFLAMGIVSGIKMRPAPDMSAHYIRPY